MSKQYPCFKCNEPIRFHKDWKDDEGKSIPLEIDKDVPHKHKSKPKAPPFLPANQLSKEMDDLAKAYGTDPTKANLEETKQILTRVSKGQPLTDSEDDILEQIFDMQSRLDVRIIENMERPPPADIDKWISMYATAIMHEALELQDLTNWKWWRKSQKFDEQKAKEELMDIWHFVVAATIEIGMKPHDVLREYERKNKINHQRQEIGY